MSEFRTIVQPLENQQGLIDHSHPVVMLGSCFSDNVGQRLCDGLFDCIVNPCGTLYNPASIANAVLDLLYDRDYTIDDLFQHEGVWHSFSHHSRFSGTDPDQVLESINESADRARKALSNASAIIVTFGTAYLFRLRENHRVVANCHKMPATMFSREMLPADKITGLWRKMVKEITARYPGMKVVFTVSPIRHLANGAHGNQISKSTLLLGVDALAREMPESVVYFPAYEIMMDDLRDYRFYTADMTHPSDVAVDYIYDVFRRSFMTDDTRDLEQQCLKLSRRLKHRHISATTEAVDGFEAGTQAMISELVAAHPELRHVLHQ